MPETATIPFNDLARSTEAVRDEVDAAIGRVLDSGWFVLGSEGAAFEEEFASFVGSSHCINVASGTDAIELALRALGIGAGDEVVTQANTCVPTVAAIERTGASPVLCDAEPEAATIDVDSLRSALTERTRAVVPVHLYGQCGDLDAVLTLCEPKGIHVVEDCAQAHGARLDGRAAGSIGSLGCFSFYPTKNLGALGDGGAVVTDDDELAERLRLLRQYGQTSRYRHEARGVNSRLDELQAAVLREKLPRVEDWNRTRREIAAVYTDALAGSPVRPLTVLPGRLHVFHLFVVDAPDRELLRTHLDRAGVATLIHYPAPVHRHPPYRRLGEGPVPLTAAERLCERVLSLPIYPELRTDEVERVASALRDFAA